eukprot:gi/632966462/ref/XP_007899428.1/ PREDICTED: poly [ADP-ribose] polymerase 14-like [Callorhinchus milii]
MACGGIVYSVYVTGLSQFKKRTVENKLAAYFQSKKKSGGGECNVNILENGEAMVTFNEKHAQKSVLERKHFITIEGKSIPLTVSQESDKTSIPEDVQDLTSPVKDASSSKPEVPLSNVQNKTLEGSDPVESSRVCIKVDTVKFSRGNVDFFIECCIGTSSFHMRHTNEATTFILEFTDDTDLNKAVQNLSRSSLEMKVTAIQLPRTAQLRVTQLPKSITQDHLELYFEHELKGLGPVKAVLDEATQSAIIDFPDAETVERILSKPHYVSKNTLKIHRYYESQKLTEFATEFDTEEPGPSNQEKDSESLDRESLDQRSKDDIEVNSNLVTEECIFKNKYYVQILSQQNLEENFSAVQFHFDMPNNVVQITGKENEVFKVQLKLFNKGNQLAINKIQLSKYLRMFLSGLNKEDFLTSLFLDSKINVACSCDEAEDGVVMYGASEYHLRKGEEKLKMTFAEDKTPIPEDFCLNKQNDFSRLIKETARSLKANHHELKNVEENYLLSHFLESKANSGVPNCLILVGYKIIINEAKKCIENYIWENSPCEIVIDVESPGVFEYVQRFFNLSEVLQDAKIEFLKNKDQLSLQVKATMKNASQIKDKVTDILNQVKSEKKLLRQPGAVQFFDKNRDLLKKLENPYKCIIHIASQGEKQTDVTVSEQSQTMSTIDFLNKFKISVVKGNIILSDAETILHPTNKSLDCTSGLSKALVDAAGHELQRALNKRQSHVQGGEAFITKAGKLPWEFIVHVVGTKPLSLTENQEVLKAAIVKALCLVNDNFSKSIAIPDFRLGESESSATVIGKAIKEYCQEVNKPCLTDIRLVCGDDNSAKAMSKALKKMMAPGSKTSKFSNFMKLSFIQSKKQETNKELSASNEQTNAAVTTIIPDPTGSTGIIFTTQEGVRVSLIKGNIAEQKVDAIVNTVSHDMNLSYGAASKAIVLKAGDQLQVNTNNAKGSTTFKSGDVLPVSTAGCKLHCQTVYNTICCQWSKAQDSKPENVLETIIQKCLENAHKSQYKSISFPAIGTGNLSFPKDLVAQTFLEEIKKFSKANSSSSLNEVNLVIYEKDLECYQAFEDEMLITSGMPANELLIVREERNIRNVHPPTGTTKEQVFNSPVPSVTIPIEDITIEVSCKKTKTIYADAEVVLRSDSKVKGTDDIKITKEGSTFLVYCRIKPQADLANILFKALSKCEGKYFGSVCIPVPQYILSGKMPDRVKSFAVAVLDAVYQFTETKHTSLTQVTVSDCSPEYVKVFEELKKIKVEKSGLASAMSKLYSWVSGSQVPDDNPEVDEYAFKPVVFQFYFTNNGNIDQAWDDIQKLVNKEQLEKKYRSVYPMKNLLLMILKKDTIFNVCQKIGKREIMLREEMFLMEKVCWKFKMENHWDKFNPTMNAHIEKAFNKRENEVKVETEEGCFFVFDFKNNMCTDDEGVSVRICRACPADDILPDNWEDVEDQTKFSEVLLKPDSSEYKEVADAFSQTLGDQANLPTFKIDSIKRIQNPTLWRLYVAKRNEMNRLAPLTQNEKILYHGTCSDVCAKINADGFNRSYSGANAVFYGDGTYFAINARYSASDQYSKPDAKGFKLIYRARVLTGEYGQGQKGLKEPPLKNQQGGPDRYDSVTDQLQSPSMFVVFQDNQAYPEYLIQFLTK